MGKKKSVVLMVLITIILVVLCGLVAFPAIPLDNEGVDSYNPIVNQYDWSMDLDGGVYTYYYPQGVKPADKYQQELNAMTGDDKTKFENEYTQYVTADGVKTSLYLSNDEKYGIYDDNGNVSATFTENFNAVAAEMAYRYEKKGYADYKLSVVDDYCMRVELPRSASDATSTMKLFVQTGKVTLKKGEELLKELKEDGAKLADFIQSITVGSKYNYVYLSIRPNAAGKAMIDGVKGELSTSDSASGEGAVSLTMQIGDDTSTAVPIYQDYIMHDGEIRMMFNDDAQRSMLETYAILYNSLIFNDGFDVEFSTLQSVDVRSFGPIFGKNVVTLLYIALGVILLAVLALPIIFMGGYGVVSAFNTLLYTGVAGICFKYILGGVVLELSLGGVLVFILGLALMQVLQYHIYNAIKDEAALGKTVDASVKGGYKKTLANVIDTYVVLLLASIALFLGFGGFNALAVQAIVCVVVAAFANLLFGRLVNYALLSAAKDKNKFYKIVREDDEDDE